MPTMVSPPVLTYVRSQLSAGVPLSDVRASLLSEGWLPEAVDAAVGAVSDDVRRSRRMLRTLLYAGLILAVAGGVLTWWLRRAETAAAVPESTPTPSASATMDPAVGTCASGSYAAYVNASKRYRLSYCSLWKVESRGSLTVFTSGATQATDRYQKHGTGDVMLSLADYLADTVKSLDVQVRDLANQFSATGVAEPLTIGTLRGYSAGMGSGVYQSYTVVIQGRYQMYILQFPLVGNRAALWEAQEKLLVSFEEV